MKHLKHIAVFLFIIAAIGSVFVMPVFAITESEVENQVNAVGKETVTGNIFIWFLCAIAFLKISQKIDSFMSSLGINVGNTGGSMLAEAMIAARGISSLKGGGGSGGSGGGSSGSSGSSSGFLSGGLAGAVGRSFNRSAVKSATGNGGGGLGGKAFMSSMSKGGNFANSVIGSVATGKVASVGSMNGENASAALSSYMGYTAMGSSAEDAPVYSDVEIGGGQISGIETSSEYPEGIAFGMYHTDQYNAPSGDYSTVTSADGATWYKQYAADIVQRTPYTAPDSSIAYREEIIKKLPDPPKRKDKN